MHVCFQPYSSSNPVSSPFQPPPMAPSHLPLLLLLLLLLLHPLLSLASPRCPPRAFSSSRHYHHCLAFPTLDASLHWNYTTSSSTLSLAYVATPSRPIGWVSWAINPSSSHMLGAQALVAYRRYDAVPVVHTYNLTSYAPALPSKIMYKVWDKEAEYSVSAGVMTMYAKVELPAGTRKVYQLWQIGPTVSDDGRPDQHDLYLRNLNAKGTLDLVSGAAVSIPTKIDRFRSIKRKKKIHGVLNVVSWGFMMPIGVIMAKYMRTFKPPNPAWFYLHVACQFSAYAAGVAGWVLGLKLGDKSLTIVYSYHRYIGITLFCVGTLQALALILRPNKHHKLRRYWNFYHHGVGYIVIILGIINIFRGFDILKPNKNWKIAYTSLLCILGAVAVVLEIVTWIIVLRSKRSEKSTMVICSESPPGIGAYTVGSTLTF